MSVDASDQPRKLGLLAGTFEDGSVSIFVVPYPQDLLDSEEPGPLYGTLCLICGRDSL